MSSPFAVATSAGRIVRWGDLDRYALAGVDEQSRQLDRLWEAEGLDDAGLVQPLWDPLRLVGLLDASTWHYRACRVKARDTAGLGWNLEPAETGAEDSSGAADNARRFLAELGEGLSTVLERASFDLEAVGLGTVELATDEQHPDGEPTGLWHVPSWTMRVHRDGDRWCQIVGARRRWFRDAAHNIDVDADTGRVYPPGSLSPERRGSAIIAWRNYTPRSQHYGAPDVIPAMRAVAGDASAADYNLSFFDNYGVPRFAITAVGDFDPGDLDEHGRTELETELEAQIAQLVERPHSTLILTIPTRGRTGDERVDVRLEPIDTQVSDGSFRMYRSDNRDEVLSAHGVDPYRVGVVVEGSLGGSVAREQTEVYRQSTLRPRQERIERLLTRHVVRVGFGADDVKLTLATVDTRDDVEDLDLLERLWTAGAVTPREVRRHFADRFGLDPDAAEDTDALDRFYIGGQPITGTEASYQDVGIPALVNARIITPNEGRRLLGLDEVAGGDELVERPDEADAAATALAGLRDELTAAAASLAADPYLDRPADAAEAL